MIFESVRWGLPNIAVIVALAAMPLASLVMPDEPHAVHSQSKSVERDASPPVEVQIAFLNE